MDRGGANHELEQAKSAADDFKGEPIDFRHLSTFQRAYQEKSYANAAQEAGATRKSVVRIMRNLERSFDCELFNEGARGELAPSPFAERLFNDLRFLNGAVQRMKDHISSVHAEGRVLRVGCSAAVFRTREFRNLFRRLQSMDGIRARYSPVDIAEAGKALVSGHCDFYIGCWSGVGNRFATQPAGKVAYRIYRRGRQEVTGAGNYVVSLDGHTPEATKLPQMAGTWENLSDTRWLHWLDHPENCPAGTLVCGPDVETDADLWQDLGSVPDATASQALHASFLRQHPYEFMPSLTARIQNR